MKLCIVEESFPANVRGDVNQYSDHRNEYKKIEMTKVRVVPIQSLVWPHEQDICPDTLYLDSEKL